MTTPPSSNPNQQKRWFHLPIRSTCQKALELQGFGRQARPHLHVEIAPVGIRPWAPPDATIGEVEQAEQSTGILAWTPDQTQQAAPAHKQQTVNLSKCQTCQHYHGQRYNQTLLVCAIHPYGSDLPDCRDHVERAVQTSPFPTVYENPAL